MAAPARLRPRMSWLDRIAVLTLPLVPRALMRRLGQRYVAGAERDAALAIGAQLSGRGYRITYDVLGEAVERAEMVEQALAEYRALHDALRAQGAEVNLSVKPTQMGLLIDEELCRRSVAELVARVTPDSGFVRFEMEDSPTTDGTLRVFAKLREEHGARVGCVLQSMLHRSVADAEALVASGAPLNVRVVKGIYVEPDSIAHQDDAPINDAYMRIVRILLEGGAFVAVATHDEKLVAAYEALLEEEPGWRERSEVQMLLGVREPLRRQIRESGIPVRAYVPYGSHWLPYVTRRLRENPKLIRYGMLGMLGGREKLGG